MATKVDMFFVQNGQNVGNFYLIYGFGATSENAIVTPLFCWFPKKCTKFDPNQ